MTALGGASMLLATAAHLFGGGHLPSLGVLLVTTFLVGLVAVTLTARRCQFWPLALALGVEQVILHEVFAAGSMGSSVVTSAVNVHGSSMAGSLGLDPTATTMGTSPLMVLSHLLATLATAWLLAYGEWWLWGLGEQAVRAAMAAPTARVRRSRPLRPASRPAVFTAFRHADADPRGPPLLAWSV